MNSYKELWQYIFPKHYRDKYQHIKGLSGGGGHYPSYDIHIGDDLLLYENEFQLAVSQEYFNVPDDWYLLVYNKSTLARQGLDCARSTIIDAGFKGFLTIELLYNAETGNSIWGEKNSYFLNKGQPILQVIACKCEFAVQSYNGKYQGQQKIPTKAILATKSSQ